MVHFQDVPNNTNATWYRDPGMRKGMCHIFILYLGVYSLGYDGSLLNGLQALTSWQRDFGAPAGTKLGLIAASYYIPKIPAGFVAAHVADRWGRKYSLCMGAVFMVAGAICGGFTPNTAGLIGSRILLGIGTVAAQLSAASLIPELAHPRIRHYAGAYLLTTFYIGSIFSSWLTFAMRIPNLIQGFGPILLFFGLWVLPESPRWLIKNDRGEEAHKILAKFHANGQMDDELVALELREIRASIELESIAKTASWTSFLKTPANRRRFYAIILVGTATQLAGNGVVQYYLVPVLKTVGITSPAQTAGINGGLAIFNWFSSLAGASLVERFGRKPLFLASFAGMLGCFILITGLAGGYSASKISSMGVAIVPFIFLFMGSYSLALTPLPLLYIPEIVPLALRAKALGIFVFSQNVSQTFNQFVNPIALAAIGWKYYGVYVGVLAAYLVGFFFLIRETKGLTVEEAAVVYESEDAKQATMDSEMVLAERSARHTSSEGDEEERDTKAAIAHFESA